MALDQSNKKSKKEVATDNSYQSTFLPIFDNAQKKIKYLVLFFFIMGYSKKSLEIEIEKVIQDVKKKIPVDLHDRDSYVNGLIRVSRILLLKQYPKMTNLFDKYKKLYNSVKVDEKGVKTPNDLLKAIKKTSKSDKELWATQKGAVRLPNYEKDIRDYINNISNIEITTVEKGKHPISLWQKAELDLRHEKQEKMLDDLKKEGVDLCWISSHPDCSKRCEKWQGKLVSLTEHSKMSGFRIRKVDGYWVYSLTDIMDQVDKYGYKNNIISGFNCRHHLIKYEKGTVAPTEFTEEEVKKQREIETKIRAMEREIRKLKTKLKNYKIISKEDKKGYNELKNLIAAKIRDYKNYCNKNGYAWHQYRIGYDN